MSDIYDARKLLEEKRLEQSNVNSEYYELKEEVDFLKNFKFSYDQSKIYDFSTKKFENVVAESLQSIGAAINNTKNSINSLHAENVLNNIYICDNFFNQFMPIFVPQFQLAENNKDYCISYKLIDEQKKVVDKLVFIDGYRIFNDIANYFLWTYTTTLLKLLENMGNKDINLSLKLFYQAQRLKVYDGLNNETMIMKSLYFVFECYIEQLNVAESIETVLDEVYIFLKGNAYLKMLNGETLKSYNKMISVLLEKYNRFLREYFIENPDYQKARFLYERKGIFDNDKLSIDAYKVANVDLFSSEFYKSYIVNSSEDTLKKEIENSLSDIVALAAIFQASDCLGDKKTRFIKNAFSIIKEKEFTNTIPLLLVERLLYNYDAINYEIVGILVDNILTIEVMQVEKYAEIFSRIMLFFNPLTSDKKILSIRNNLLLYNKKFFNNYFLIRKAKRNKNSYLYQCYLFSLSNIKIRYQQSKNIKVNKETNKNTTTYVKAQSPTRVRTINFILVLIQLLLLFSPILMYHYNILSIINESHKIMGAVISALSIPVFYLLVCINCCRDRGGSKFLLISNLIISYLAVLFYLFVRTYVVIDIAIIHNWFYVGIVYLGSLNICQYIVTNHKTSSLVLKIVNSGLIIGIVLLRIFV